MATDRLSQSRGRQGGSDQVNSSSTFASRGQSYPNAGKRRYFGTGENDTLTGDAGNTFVFSFLEQNFGTDTITDFKVGCASWEMDKIML